MKKHIKHVKHVLNHATSLGGRAPDILTRYLRYVSSSIVPVMTDYFVLLLFVEILYVQYLVSATFGFITGTIVSYFVTRRWSFKGSKTSHKKGSIMFLVINGIGLFLTITLLGLSVELLNIHYFLARFVISMIVGIFMFFANYRFTFELHKSN